MTHNELVLQIAKRVKELVGLTVETLRYRTKDMHKSKGEIIEEILTEEFCVDDNYEIGPEYTK